MEPRTVCYLMRDEGDRAFGPGPCRLLELVGEKGSLSAAAKAMGMSYTKATRLVRNAEESLGAPLTRGVVGGEGGGGSSLTQRGEEAIRRYRLWEASVSDASRQAYRVAFAGECGNPRIPCVVMAAGHGERFGGQKLLARLGGREVLARTLASVPLDVYDVVVVTRAPEVRALCERYGFTSRLSAGDEQSDTIRAGLEWAGNAPGCLFLQGDQPLVSTASLRALAEAFARDPRGVARLSWQGRPGSPVIFPNWLFGELARTTGDRGGSAVLKANPALERLVTLVPAAEECELEDVDTPDDLERLEAHLEGDRGHEPGGASGGARP
ncbi:MAG: LysR family transcriptional regulator [Coriobacteriaceae bacterium]|jgi:molybdate transport repressor ModE-like protein|nr:NTP transferase domain-containing protein [Olsenella sp.]RRF90241.1 MAG: LysR family transcriptional regulator [Coriobacteriaceae bacterium]